MSPPLTGCWTAGPNRSDRAIRQGAEAEGWREAELITNAHARVKDRQLKSNAIPPATFQNFHD
jgi:hypothetical protein